MSNDPASLISTARTNSLGDRIRDIAQQLRQENSVQIKATARILGAAAQIAQNHDFLIDEVVEMVEEDLDQQAQAQTAQPYTAEQLKKQFKTLKDAKAHFGITASSWAALAAKLNEQPINTDSPAGPSPDAVSQRLDAIEQEIQTLRGDIHQVINLLTLIAKKLP
jgi:hypothetical protein